MILRCHGNAPLPAPMEGAGVGGGGGVTIKPELNIANYKKEKQSQLYPQNSARLPGANTDMHSLPWKRAVSGGTFEIQYRELQRKKINQNDIVTISFRFQTQDQDRTPYEATRKRKEKKRDERCRRIRGWILRKTTAVAMATRHFFSCSLEKRNKVDA